MDRTARQTINRMRQRGFRVLFQCNPDTSIAIAAISPKGEAFIVHGKLCDDSRIVGELAAMVGLKPATPAPAGGVDCPDSEDPE
jgi:hypothetical protein